MSGHSDSSSSRSRYRERRLPKTAAVNALLYFSGRNPMMVKGIRAYGSDDMETRSTGSGASTFSWSSRRSDVYLVESTTPYWHDYPDPEPTTRKKQKSSKKSRSSRAFPLRPPTGTWPRNATVHDVSDDDDHDDGSVEGFATYGQPHTPFPHPGMMPPHSHSPGFPPGASQPVRPGMYTHTNPPAPPHPAGFAPPPARAAAPPPPRGHFVPGRGGIQVFADG
ncbi:hypothetical protein MMYC01_206395 [Madurella mycetomatis]|uniref:Uncharacterized protein n=1 Tax=Madurella mycetomatis TaxID=100816 RepID=A0A175W026_9PEZI|nr:hypothetical protein MMYC01_206395 [Madurella mycetomatis]